MKKLIVLLLIACFTSTIYSQVKQDTIKIKDKLKTSYRVGKSVVTVWEKPVEGKYGKFISKEFKVEKIYKKGEKWESTSSYNLTELLQLRAAIDKAINEEGVKTKNDTDEIDE
jgi:hypothetical protein